MPENPIVVFFHRSSTQTTLPIAFSSDGALFDPTQESKEASLIVLDDEAQGVPALQHTNSNPSAPLGVIWHNEDEAKKRALVKYGQPARVAGFSHVPGNHIFDSIKTILENKGDIEQSVNGWRKVLVQFGLDELAALITYMALVPEGGQYDDYANSRYEKFVERYEPVDGGKSIKSAVKEGRYLEAVGILEEIAGGGA